MTITGETELEGEGLRRSSQCSGRLEAEPGNPTYCSDLHKSTVTPLYTWMEPWGKQPTTIKQQCFTLQAILGGFLYDFPHDVRKCTDPIVGAAVEIYQRMSTDLLPTPAKSHYVFNLRDLSKCIQGIVLEISRSSE